MLRLNPIPRPSKPKKKKVGRPRKPKRPPKKVGRKRIPRRFDETPIGHAMRLRTPLEFGLLFEVVGPNGTPGADLIEAISYASTNSYFRTAMFRKQLITYRKDGCTTEHPKAPPTPDQIRRAIELRKNAAKRID